MKIAFVYNLKRSDSMDEAEFDTAEVIDAISQALASAGDEVIPVEMTQDGEWIQTLSRTRPDIIFNTSEGFKGVGREAYAPTVFEQLGLNFVGSDPYACFLTLDKFLTKKVVTAKGVPAPDGVFISSPEDINVVAKELDYPVFVKPNFEGSSKGITQRSKCNNEKEFKSYAKESLAEFPLGLIVERYISGKDITVPYISNLNGNGVLEPVEYTGTTRGENVIYDYAMKNSEDEDTVGILCPADISPEVRQKVIRYMEIAVKALGINDMARADFRITPSGDVFFIEINALPSLQPGAGLFASTALLGKDYNETIQTILKTATNRTLPRGVKRGRNIRQRNPTIGLVFNVKRKQKGDPGYEAEAEFDSPETIESIAKAIEANGYPCKRIEANRDLAKNLNEQAIDVVFNIAEGLHKKSREAQVPALCDLLDIEHSGSDASCLSLTLNKALSTKIVGSEGLHVPRSALFRKTSKNLEHSLNYPLILKPNLEGSSKGVYQNSVVHSQQELKERLGELFERFEDAILVEEYIQGREFTVGLLGGQNPKVVGISEIVFKTKETHPVYSYEYKQIPNPYDNEIYDIVSPPEVSASLKSKLHKKSKAIFDITGCRDVARIDFRVTSDEKVYFIEVNPLPGLSPGFSDLPVLAERNGMPYEKLIGSILRPAVSRWRKR